MFKCTDAFIYGYLVGLNMDIPMNPNKNIGSSSVVIGGGSGSYFPALACQMGRGGGLRGENGKPMPGDIASPGSQLVGAGGGISGGGNGQHKGQFGYGGNGGFGFSAGGGGGWYGGGSSTIQAGAGGGSGFVWCSQLKQYAPPGYSVPEEYMALTMKLAIGDKWGNGECQIMAPNGVKTVFKYTGTVQEYVVPTNGVYTITCWGAQGGSIDKLSDQYSGGFGGTAMGTFNLNAGLVLYIYVGKEGGISSVNRPFNGGGVGVGGCTDGGGATDVRLEKTADLTPSGLYSRLIVAGGGGGCGTLKSGGTAIDDETWGTQIDKDVNIDPNNSLDAHNGITVDLGIVSTSDLSNLHMDMFYNSSLDTTENMRMAVYEDGAQIFNREVPLKQGEAYENQEFHFWDILPEYTDAYLSRIVLKIFPEDDIIVPEGGLTAWIETPTRLIDKNNPESESYNKPVLQVKRDLVYIGDSNVVTLIDVPSGDGYLYKDNILIDDNFTIDIVDKPLKKDELIKDNIVMLDAVVVNNIDVEFKHNYNKTELKFGDSVVVNKEDKNEN